MNISSVNQALLSQREYEYFSANTNFTSTENIFSSVNFEYTFAESAFNGKNFEKALSEAAYQNVQNKLKSTRLKQDSFNTTTLVLDKNIKAHEAQLKATPEIQALELKIKVNQSKLADCQQKLTTARVSPEVTQYKFLSAVVKNLGEKEAYYVKLITQKSAQGEDITELSVQLENIRKEKEQKQEELTKLQPKYDEMQALEKEVEKLMSENSKLVNERLALDPELVGYSMVSSFFGNVMTGENTGLGVEKEMADYKDELSTKQEDYINKSDDTQSLQEILNKNLTLRNSVKSELNFSKLTCAEKESLYLKVKV